MKQITLISGSTLGNAEYVADHLAGKLQEAGFATKTLHGPELNDLMLSGLWLIITSTHGAGELPDNLQPLLDQLTKQQPDLSAINFGSIGLGSSEYDTFCAAIHTLDQQLITRGAQRIGEVLEIDVIEHAIPEDCAEIWLKNWLNMLYNVK